MAATKGRALRVSVATTLGGSYTNVAGIDSGTIDLDGVNVDVTTLTDADIVRIQAMKDTKVTLSGNYEADTSGQGAIRTALEADSDLFVKFLPDGTTGWKLQVKPSKYSIGSSITGKASVSIDLDGSGAKTAV